MDDYLRNLSSIKFDNFSYDTPDTISRGEVFFFIFSKSSQSRFVQRIEFRLEGDFAVFFFSSPHSFDLLSLPTNE